MTLARPASRTAASNGNSCSSRSSRWPTWTGAWFRPPSASPWPTMCLPVAMTPSREIRSLERPDVGAGRARPRGTGPRRRSPRSGPSAGRGRCRGPGPARGGRRSPASAGGSSRPRGDEVGVEGGRRADRLLEARRVPGEQAVEGFLVDDRRDPEPGLLDQEPLDRVRRASDSCAAGSWNRPAG